MGKLILLMQRPKLAGSLYSVRMVNVQPWTVCSQLTVAHYTNNIVPSYMCPQVPWKHSKQNHGLLVKHNLLALQQCASEQFANCIPDVRAGNDGDGPFLPFAVPVNS